MFGYVRRNSMRYTKTKGEKMRYVLKTRQFVVVTDDYEPKEYKTLIDNLKDDLRRLRLNYGRLYDIDGNYLQKVTV